MRIDRRFGGHRFIHRGLCFKREAFTSIAFAGDATSSRVSTCGKLGLMLLYVLYFAAAAALALRTLAGTGAVETLPAVARALAGCTLAGAPADIALHSMFFIHTEPIVYPHHR